MPELLDETANATSAPRSGMRGVFLGKPGRAYISVVASPTASYLLPDLLPALGDVSFGVVETSDRNGVRIIGDSVIVGLSIPRGTEEGGRVLALEQAIDGLGMKPGEHETPTVDEGFAATPGRTVPAVASSHAEDTVNPLSADASIQAIASRLHDLSGLSDARLADLFKVTRETFNRWRSGVLTNPTEGARRRAGIVLHLLEELVASQVRINDWLQNPTAVEGVTPYDLLLRGRIDEVAYLASAISEEPPRVGAEIGEDSLVFEDDDDGWESYDIEVADSEA